MKLSRFSVANRFVICVETTCPLWRFTRPLACVASQHTIVLTSVCNCHPPVDCFSYFGLLLLSNSNSAWHRTTGFDANNKKLTVTLSFLVFLSSSREDEMDAEEFIARLTPVVDYRGTAAAAQAEPLLQWFRVLCTRILEEPHPAVVALEQRYNPERDLNKVRGRRDVT